MINPKAIDAFIRQERDDWRWIKDATVEELSETFHDVPIHTTPYVHQWAALALGVANPNFMFFLDMGLGKAQSLDSKLLTPRGWIRMGDVHKGTQLLGRDGRPCTVRNVFPQGELQLYRVILSDGSSTRCCNEHLWTIMEGDSGEWVTRDLRWIRRRLGDRHTAAALRIPMVDPLDFGRHAWPDTTTGPYQLGKLIGSGIITVPEYVLTADLSQRLCVLHGIMDTVGEADCTGRVTATLPSYDVRNSVQQLIWSLGGTARCTPHLSTNLTSIVLPEGYSPFRENTVAEGQLRAAQTTPVPQRYIVAVEPAEVAPAQCIEVDSPDALYITDDYIVTHNTKLLLDLFQYRKVRGEAKRVLVLVPNFTNIQSWVDEIQVHQPSLRGVGLDGSAKQRKALLDADADVWIINYQGLQSLATRIVNRKRIVDEEAIEDLANRFDMIGMDEIHKCKNPNSLTFELCLALCEAARFRYGLTGTPFGRNPMDLWAQFFLIDGGESLGHHPQVFKETFFNQTMNRAGFVDWEFDKRKKRLLNRMIQHRSIRYRDRECMDLPRQVFRQVRVPWGVDALRHQQQMLTELQEKAMSGSDDDGQQENNFVKMRTLASGFMRVYELDDEGRKTKHYDDIVFKEQPKIEALIDLLESLPEEEKVVVFHEFITSGDMVCAALKKAGIPYLALNAKTEDRKAFLHKFREDDHYRVAVVNSKSGSTGLNLQRANHMVFFESPVSPIERQQAEKRTHRGGQKRPCFYYDLITINSVDERIQEFIAEGKDLMQAVVEQQGSSFLTKLLAAAAPAKGGKGTKAVRTTSGPAKAAKPKVSGFGGRSTRAA